MLIKNLWRRRTRTLLTALGVAIGVAAVIALTAFGEGMADGFQGVMAASEADLTVGQKDAMMLLFSSVDAEVGSELKQIPGVPAVAVTFVGFVQMTDARYVGGMGEDRRALRGERGHRGVERRSGEVADHDGGPGPGEGAGRLAADATARAGHHGHAAPEVERVEDRLVHVSCLRVVGAAGWARVIVASARAGCRAVPAAPMRGRDGAASRPPSLSGGRCRPTRRRSTAAGTRGRTTAR